MKNIYINCGEELYLTKLTYKGVVIDHGTLIHNGKKYPLPYTGIAKLEIKGEHYTTKGSFVNPKTLVRYEENEMIVVETHNLFPIKFKHYGYNISIGLGKITFFNGERKITYPVAAGDRFLINGRVVEKLKFDPARYIGIDEESK